MDTKEILRRHNIRPNKKMGQNFLIDDKVAERQVGYAEPQANETILEIGGGLGILTQKLLKRECSVKVVEKDRKLQEVLQERFGDKITLIKGDALEVNLGSYDKIVANLPYQISSEITFRILKKPFKKAVLMYQKEFAERMTAKPGTKKYGRLTVGVNHYAESRVLETVGRHAFYPQPKIDSALIQLTPKKPVYRLKNQDFFFSFTKAIFSQRRKKLKNALMNTKHMMKPKPDEKTIKRVVDKIKEYRDKRPEDLTPSQIAECSNKLLKEMKRSK
ncbi:16S rRNA (adenine(1518)-N(6)/adenine(1519)-N(6))-dimethyltransferase RsmA [Methanonatronarchaeum sp. AMET6-2]|uniref:16S rRNA (adenine(1518)-N(6)/adenine(1519)-N(6))- dimethyltransferase RsmA n=1 Tax=Methanonatronarchaeum sp. AMET6-2 TaxID=2933293 RepID=UPI00120DD74F|nr:16S rRNA (adenine(1518)-N(6)/adenine(1519)-N(6))-dimethyltransferase RsmA [Methanonatronarchaeum sp. AMET6-2]RZN63473.1 MAG: ribosomal RNA small subunit methyltransferase A [Methanonatronarchaeia archaeon]UOY09745.1 16S rRNA (adenine(1518)-N(6)/adenine(1519)-N(6))-dimethyltransferase RsmA [Methanonatronarchaeum sp. AMET6-2]